MVHPATLRTVKTAITTLNVPLDVGFVFPPKPGEARGYGQWTNRDLGPDDVMAMLPDAAAANARGGNVFMRLGPSAKDAHPSVVMLDDLTSDAVEQLSLDGFEPCLTVETSPGNFQAWIRLMAGGTVAYAIMAQVMRHLAQAYGSDERAISPRQPGRLVGFTNRKPKHQMRDGRFPFVRLTRASPGCVASNGDTLINRLSKLGTAGAAAGAAPKTPRDAAIKSTSPEPEITNQLDSIHQAQKGRIRRELAQGRRPINAASESEIDFAVTRAALAAGIAERDIADWMRRNRVEKDETYPERTLNAAVSWRFVMK